MTLASKLMDDPLASGEMDRDLLGIGQESLINDSVGAAMSNTNLPATDQGGIDSLLSQDKNSVTAALTGGGPQMTADLDPLPAADATFVSAEITSGQTMAQNEANIRTQARSSFRQGNNMGNDQREMEAATLAANKATTTLQKDVQQQADIQERSISALSEDMVDDLTQEQADTLSDALSQNLTEQQRQQIADNMASALADRLDQPLELSEDMSEQMAEELEESMAQEMASALTTDQKQELANDLADNMLDTEFQDRLADARIEALAEGLDEGLEISTAERQELADQLAKDHLEQLSVEEKQELAEQLADKYADKLSLERQEDLLDTEIDLAIEAMPETDLEALRTEIAADLSLDEKKAIASELVEKLDREQTAALLDQIPDEDADLIYKPIDELEVENKIDVYAKMERAGLDPEQLDQLAVNIDLDREEQAQAIADKLLDLDTEPQLETVPEIDESSALGMSEQEMDLNTDLNPGQVVGQAVGRAARVEAIKDLMAGYSETNAPGTTAA